MSDEEFMHKNMLLLEELHKTCQLSGIGIIAPVLNELRYYARNVTFFQYYKSIGDEVASTKHLSFAKNALLIAVNDAVDVLVTHIKFFLHNLREGYPDYDIALGAHKQKYAIAIRAMFRISEKIVESRGDPEKRVNIYSDFAYGKDKEQLQLLSEFALMLPSIEIDAANTKESGVDFSLYQAMIEAALVGSDSDYNLEMYIQPKIRLERGNSISVLGGEALVRLVHCGDIIPTFSVIQAAEASGQIVRLDFWILDRALVYLANHPELNCISVNLTPVDLSLPDYSERVKELIEKHYINPERLELEITERSAVKDTMAISHIQALSAYGVRFAIDDFGRGETKFDYIAELPVKVLKIDMSIIRKYQNDSDRYGKLIAAIASIGEVCGMDVIAEGVDNEVVLNGLLSLNVQNFQGYFFSKPVPELEFLATTTRFAQGLFLAQ